MMMKTVPMLLGCALALSVSACDPEPLFEDCPLSTRIKAVCADANEGSDVYTCVVADHPWCLEKICASWEKQPSVCTRACSTDADCADTPKASVCREDTTLNIKFCVLQEHLDAAAAASSSTVRQ